MTSRASMPSESDRPLRDRVGLVENELVDLISRVDHHDYVEGKIASIDEQLRSFVARYDDDRASEKRFQEKVLAKLGDVHASATEGSEKAGSTLLAITNAANLATLVPPRFRGVVSIILLLVLLIASTLTTLERLGVIGMVHR